MNGQYSWKRTEEAEADLAELLRSVCRQWRRIVACALVSAVVLGGYGWLKGRGDTDVAESVTEAEDVLTEAEDVLTEAEEQEVTAAVKLNDEIRELETYMDSSVLMQIDPYHKSKVIMLYRIDNAKVQELPVITESCLNFVINGGAADALRESSDSWNMDKSCQAELISAYQKTYSSPYQVIMNGLTDNGMTQSSLFFVEITGKNSEKAEKMAADMQDVLEKYSARIQDDAGNHRLTLISSAGSVTADSVLQSQQRDKQALLSSNKTNLKTMLEAFSKEQMEIYKKTAGVEYEAGQIEAANDELSDEAANDELSDEAANDELSDEAALAQGFSVVTKYIALGFMGGIFVYIFLYLCWYVFCDTVKSVEEMKKMYTFPVYGRISLEDKDKKKSRGISVPLQDAYGCTKEQVMNRIRLACKKKGIKRLCIVSDFSLALSEKESLQSMAGQLKDWEIDITVAERISKDIVMWDSLTEIGNVLIICRMGITTHRMIDDAMNFYLENGIAVIGAVAFSQNG